MPTVSLKPTALSDPNGNIASGLVTDVDEGISAPDGNEQITIANAFSGQNPSYTMEDLPGDAGDINTVLLFVRARVESFADDTVVYGWRPVGTNAGGFGTLNWVAAIDTGKGLETRVTAGSESPSAADINAWTIEIQQTYSQSMGPDGIFLGVDCFEIQVDYDVVSGTTYTQSVAGSLTPAGLIVKEILKNVLGVLIPTSVLGRIKLATQVVAGVLAPVGVLTKLIIRSMAGEITPTGATIKGTFKSFTGLITPTGAIIKDALKNVTGSLTPTGALGTAIVFLRTIAGALTPSGGIVKNILKGVSGTLTSSGEIVKYIFKSFAGSVTPTGSIIKETQKSFAGSVIPTGALETVIIFLRTVTGSLTPSGGIVKGILKNVSGALAPTGAAVKKTFKVFIGLVTPVGLTTKETQKSFAGTLPFFGALAAFKDVVGALIDQFNDLVMDVTGPQIDDGLLAHYKANGATSDTLNDAEYQYLIARGMPPGVLGDMWNTYLIGKGYSGGITEMKHAWWKDSAPL